MHSLHNQINLLSQCSLPFKAILHQMIAQNQHQRLGFLSLQEKLLQITKTNSILVDLNQKKNLQKQQSRQTQSQIVCFTEQKIKKKQKDIYFNASDHKECYKKEKQRFRSKEKDMDKQKQYTICAKTIKSSNYQINQKINAEIVNQCERTMTNIALNNIHYHSNNQNYHHHQGSPIDNIPNISINHLNQKNTDKNENPGEYLEYQMREEQLKRQKCQHLGMVNNWKDYRKHQFVNGAVYEGQVNSNNQFEGNGTLYYPNHQVCYSGHWKQNAFHGFGLLYNQHQLLDSKSKPTHYQDFTKNSTGNWTHFEGHFFMDQKDGFGTLFFNNGDKFSGCFKNDNIEGFGTFYYANGAQVNGIWKENILKN